MKRGSAANQNCTESQASHSQSVRKNIKDETESRGSNDAEDVDLEMADATTVFEMVKQDPSVRRKIRSQYRQLIDDVKAQKEEDLHAVDIEKVIKEADKIYSNVKRSLEAAYDSELLRDVSGIVCAQAQALKTSFYRFDVIEFADALAVFLRGGDAADATTSMTARAKQEASGSRESIGDVIMRMTGHSDDEGNDEETVFASCTQRGGAATSNRITSAQWTKLGRVCTTMLSQPPLWNYLYGAFDPDEVVPLVKPRKEREKKEQEKVVAQKLQKTDVGAKGKGDFQEQTSVRVVRVVRCLKRALREAKGQPLGFYDFTFDPESFTATAENMFYVSFLVKDGLAKIYLGDDNLPYIDQTEKLKNQRHAAEYVADVEDADTEHQRASITNQAVMHIDYDQWEAIIKTFGIRQAMITHKE